MTDRCASDGDSGFLVSNLCRHLLAEGHAASVDVIGNPGFKLIPPRHDGTVVLVSPSSFACSTCLPCTWPSRLCFVLRIAGVLGFIVMDSGGGLPHTASPSSTCTLHRANFLQSPTSEVYGDPIMHPLPGTNRNHVNPISEMVVISQLGSCGQFDFVSCQWSSNIVPYTVLPSST